MDPRRDLAPPLDPTSETLPAGADLSAGGALPDLLPAPDAGGATTDDAADGGDKVSRVAGAAQSAAGDVASTVGDEAKKVTAAAADQARSVVQEAKGQVGSLVDQTRSELKTQASERGAQAAQGLRSLSGQLQALADGRPGEAGPLAGYLDEARSKVSSLAGRLDEGGIEGVLGDVTDFARRRPGLFLGLAAGTGFLVGRMVRSGVKVTRDGNGDNAGDVDRLTARSLPAGTTAQLAPPSQVTAGVQVP